MKAGNVREKDIFLGGFNKFLKIFYSFNFKVFNKSISEHVSVVVLQKKSTKYTKNPYQIGPNWPNGLGKTAGGESVAVGVGDRWHVIFFFF